MRTYHFPVKDSVTVAAKIAEAVRDVIESPPDLFVLQRFHDLVAAIDIFPVADPLSERLAGADRDRVRELGRWLAEYGTRRSAVATGIVLIALGGDERDRELLLLLGSLEDLTLYAVIALGRTQSDRDMAIFELARRVRAWGRIQAVTRLEGTTDPEIKAWLLRDGFHNKVMDDYLAYIAATTGDLVGALMEPEVDDELLDGAGSILALLSTAGGPFKGITDYPEGPQALDRYFTLVRDRPSVRRACSLLLLGDKGREILTELPWIDVVRHALDSDDLEKFSEALWPARKLGLKTADRIAVRLERHPVEEDLWFWFAGADQAVETAERLLPLADLATGPALDHDMGLGFEADRVLGMVVGTRKGARSWSLVRTALTNRVISNRRAAVGALKAWPRDSLPAEALPAVRAAVRIEPDDEIKAAMTELLAA